ncbi:MAG: transglycosylase SLT domain-containing protein, partial [Parvibaculaceae bacterium]
MARQPHTTVCALIEAAAREHDLPVSFFTRLIWKESAFRPDAVSPKGAQGIAQFMPGTAAMRGLADPFDPHQAIPASASLLRDLRARFGNLGLAAAAYNAGADRVANWMAGTGYLPLETEDYVLSITGTAAERWA